MGTVPNDTDVAARTSYQLHQIQAVIRDWGAAADDRQWTVTLADGQEIVFRTGSWAVAELRQHGYRVRAA